MNKTLEDILNGTSVISYNEAVSNTLVPGVPDIIPTIRDVQRQSPQLLFSELPCQVIMNLLILRLAYMGPSISKSRRGTRTFTIVSSSIPTMSINMSIDLQREVTKMEEIYNYWLVTGV